MERKPLSETDRKVHRAAALGDNIRALDAEAKALFGPKAKVVLWTGAAMPATGGNRGERRGLVRDARKGRS